MYVSPADSLNVILASSDGSVAAGRVLKSTDQFLSVIARHRQIYGLYQTIIGELNIGVWQMDLSPVSVISSLE